MAVFAPAHPVSDSSVVPLPRLVTGAVIALCTAKRFASTPTRTKSADGAYAPFGESYGTGGGPPILAFSGQNQDTATGLYDFLFREYAPTQGRWISPDPAGLAAADPSNPQSWNRYGYVANGPLTTVDPLGLCRPGPNGEYVCKRVCSDTPQMCANSFMGMTDLQLQQIEVWTGTPGSENGDRRFLGYALSEPMLGGASSWNTEGGFNGDRLGEVQESLVRRPRIRHLTTR